MTYLVVILTISYAAALAARKYPVRGKGLLGQKPSESRWFCCPCHFVHGFFRFAKPSR